MKNYVIQIMGKAPIPITAQEAAVIASEWEKGKQIIRIGKELVASHQICSIAPTDRKIEKDLCEVAGIELKDAPRIEQFLSNKKLLT